ncbi:MAG: UbiA prenyltransferase [Polyangiaceae bacterium]|jgi:1,4-dihydroxy-2-naphthoate octaprenyltransferase|nr:UbiA prenyltransferase [Polyangiaceae bacterium]
MNAATLTPSENVASVPRPLWSLFVHLRLHYQLVFLSPLFAWGFALGGGEFSRRAGWGFLAFHVFLYGGITAYNSFYDRDEGPVGGLRQPPAVTAPLLGFSLAVQLVGLALTLLVGWQLAALYVIVMVLSVAYSHPRFRWKARPLLSLLVVALGQGAVGFRAGWLCAATPPLPLLSSYEGLLGMGAAILLTTGFYPLSQLYQIDEDRQRGDLTFAVTYGAKASFHFSLACLVAGGLCIALVVLTKFGLRDAMLAFGAQLLLWWVVLRWHRNFQSEVMGNFVTLHRLQLAVSAGTLGYVSFRLLLG